jgi:hypothetical protein
MRIGSMARQSRARGDDGVRIFERSSARRLVLALGLAASLVLVAGIWLLRARGYTDVDHSLGPQLASQRRIAPSAVLIPPPSHAPGAPKPIAADDAAENPEPPEYEDPLFGVDQSGEPSGLALFPPLGTDPLRAGVIVPEDFELPEGYVRHYQVTDDGGSLPAVLMLHPDYQLVDESGQRIAVPESRVLPPELAPPGMPIRMLELPEGEQSLAP